MSYRIDMKKRLFTPHDSLEILDKFNAHNRRMNIGRANSFADDIKNGRFLFSHQGVARDRRGNLMDGQTRLMGIVKAGIAVEMFEFTYDLDLMQDDGTIHPVMMCFDKGRPRTVGANLQLNGISSAVQTAAICNVILGLMIGAYNRRSQEHEIMAVFSLYQDDIKEIMACGWGNKDRKAPLFAVLAMMHSVFPVEARNLATALASGCDITQGSAAHALRKFVQYTLPSMTGGTQRSEAIDRIINGCMKYMAGESVSALCASESAKEKFMSFHKKQSQLIISRYSI